MSTAGPSAHAGPSPQTSKEGDDDHKAIVLVDHTQPRTTETDERDYQEVQKQPSNQPPQVVSPTDTHISRRSTRVSLQHTLTQRKYARYQEDTFVERPPPDSEVASPTKRTRRGKTLVKGIWRGKKLRQRVEDDAIIEVIYENQRGFFTFGISHFSSKGLLNFDPKPWTNAQKQESPVNITNAQLPDPNWEWAWKSWYVDMSRDVDEDGWEYSFAFYGCAWHGNHPWFHSFVRRRRWLRKRVRKHTHHAHGKTMGQNHLSEAHMLTPEYFTIHPSRTVSRPGSIITTDTRTLDTDATEDVQTAQEVSDIATLLRLMRNASIDREKIALLRSFTQNATDELVYLHDEMPHLMSILVFQTSRKELLRLLLDELDSISDREGTTFSALQETDKNSAKGKSPASEDITASKERDETKTRSASTKKADALRAAAAAADAEVRKLQFWSDIRGMMRSGETAGAVEGESAGWDHGTWAGLDGSGPGGGAEFQGAKEPGQSREEIRKEAEELVTGHGDETDVDGEDDEGGDGQEELPRVGPSNDVHRLASEEAIDLEEYDDARETTA